MLLDSELPCSGLACSPNDPEVLHDHPKSMLQNTQPEFRFNSRLFTGTGLLKRLKRCHCSQQAASVGGVKVVQSISCTLHHRKGHSSELLPQPLQASPLRDNVVTDPTVFEACHDSLDFVHGDGQLSRYLNEHQEAFVLVAELLTFQFSPCDLDGKVRCAVGSSSKPVREHSQENRCSDAQECTHGRPGLPPDHAIGNAWAHARTHAVPQIGKPPHALMPLWIGRHSAMRPRARAARPQGVKDGR